MKVSIGQIHDGREGTIQTLERMFELIEQGQVDPILVEATRAAIGNTSFRREKRLVSKAIKGILRNVRILEDPVRHEFIQTAAVTLQTGRGDCDDLVILAGSALEHMGFEVDLVVGSQARNKEFTHVWLRTWLPIAQRWLPVDPRGMLEFGWPVGRELRNLTAIETFSYDEETKRLQRGRSSMRGSLARPIRASGRRARRQLGLFVQALPPAPSFEAIGPVAIIGRVRRARQIKPSIRRDIGPRMRPVKPLPGLATRAARMRAARLGQTTAFKFLEESGPLMADVSAGAGELPQPLEPADITARIQLTEQQQLEKVQKRTTTIQFLTIAALATGIFRNVSS